MYKYAAVFAAGLAVGWIYNGSLWSAKHERLISEHAQAVAEGQAKVRAVETLYASKLDEVVHDAQSQADAIAVDAHNAASVSERLREENDRLRRAASSSSAPADCSAAKRTMVLYSKLLDRADDRAGNLAKEADRRRVAGLACEASYDAIRQQGR